MEVKVPNLLATTQQPPAAGEPKRRSANFHPTVWGDYFLKYASDSTTGAAVDDVETAKKHHRLKEEVRGLFPSSRVKASHNEKSLSEIETLTLIDDLQRLAISYHFENEIDHALQRIYHDQYKNNVDNEDLYVTALRFRLLRQNSYNVSVEVFNKLKDNNGHVLKELPTSVEDLLSIYEAAQLSIHGEHLLDEAHAFTTSRLESLVPHLSPHSAEDVRRALKRPIHKGLHKFEAKHLMNVYMIREDKTSHNYKPLLLTFAKLDFNLLQKVHQKELASITRWWKKWDLPRTLPFARDRVVECYFWIVGVYFEPQRSIGRKITTKTIKMISVMDDIYDVYGTLEELELLTEAIDRWDINVLGQLPEYQKDFYRALLDLYDEIEKDMGMEDKSYGVYYAKEAMKRQAKAYMEEARWFYECYVPKMDEYMRVATASSGYTALVIAALLGMGNHVTKDTFEWMFRTPRIIKASQIINRLMSDKVAHKAEQARGHSASAVECYMKEYGATEEEAYEEFDRQVANAWKDLNEECLRPTAVPLPVLEVILNFTRAIDIIYKDKDGYTLASTMLKDRVTSLLIDPIE